MMTYKGEGIEHDDHKAFEWLQKAAHQGDSVAWASWANYLKTDKEPQKI
jgi:TPR repeat protein